MEKILHENVTSQISSSLRCGWGDGHACAGWGFARPAARRTFHLSISTDALDADPELLPIISAAGITDVWIAGFLYGHWYYSLEKIRPWRERGRAPRHGRARHQRAAGPSG